MSYIAVTEPQSNPFAPLTSELVKQLRDNPIAIAEGAAGAPRVKSRAFEGLILNSFTTSGVTFVGLVDLSDYNEVIFTGHYTTLDSGDNNQGMQIRFSTDNGSSWGSSQTVFTINSGVATDGAMVLHVNLDTGKFSASCQARVNNGVFTVPAGVNGVQLAPKRVGGGFLQVTPYIAGGRL